MTRTLKEILADIVEIPTTWNESPITVNSRDIFGSSPLHVAVIRGDWEAAKVLLDAGADVNCVGESGYTPLHEAVEQGHLSLVLLLLQRGASGDVKNEDGCTPLELAQIIQENEIARVLSAG